MQQNHLDQNLDTAKYIYKRSSVVKQQIGQTFEAVQGISCNSKKKVKTQQKAKTPKEISTLEEALDYIPLPSQKLNIDYTLPDTQPNTQQSERPSCFTETCKDESKQNLNNSFQSSQNLKVKKLIIEEKGSIHDDKKSALQIQKKCSKIIPSFVVIKNIHIITISYHDQNKLMRIHAESRVDSSQVLEGQFNRKNITQQMKEYCAFPSQLFSQLKKNQSSIQVNILNEIKFDLAKFNQDDTISKKDHFRLQLTIKKLGVEEKLLRRMELLQKQYERLKGEMTIITKKHHEELEAQKQKTLQEKRQKQKFIKELEELRAKVKISQNQWNKNVQDLTQNFEVQIDDNGVMLIPDKDKKIRTIQIQQQKCEINLVSHRKTNLQRMQRILQKRNLSQAKIKSIDECQQIKNINPFIKKSKKITISQIQQTKHFEDVMSIDQEVNDIQQITKRTTQNQKKQKIRPNNINIQDKIKPRKDRQKQKDFFDAFQSRLVQKLKKKQKQKSSTQESHQSQCQVDKNLNQISFRQFDISDNEKHQIIQFIQNSASKTMLSKQQSYMTPQLSKAIQIEASKPIFKQKPVIQIIQNEKKKKYIDAEKPPICIDTQKQGSYRYPRAPAYNQVQDVDCDSDVQIQGQTNKKVDSFSSSLLKLSNPTAKKKQFHLSQYYSGQNPSISRQEQNQLLAQQQGYTFYPRKPKHFQTQYYKTRKVIWKDFAADINNQAFKQIFETPDYSSVRKLFKMHLKLGTMSFVQLFYNLKELDLTDNNITYIQGLKDLKKIQILDLSENQITVIQNLEDQINMRQLLFRSNRISAIDNIYHMRKLDTLSLQDNLIQQVNSHLVDFNSLQHLYLNKNSIRKLPFFFTKMRLHALRIQENPIDFGQVSNQAILAQLKSMHCTVYTLAFLDN